MRPRSWHNWESDQKELGNSGLIKSTRIGCLQEAPPASPLAGAVVGTLLGSEGFVERMRRWVAARLPDREVPAARTLRRQVGLAGIERETGIAFGVPASALRVRGRRGNDARAAAIYLARALTATPVTAIGAHFGGVGGQAISNTVRQVQKRLAAGRAFARKLASIEENCRMTT